ncbi:Paternally-expressed gene 3 protein [Manis javanica]|nr:Paternally-expressed gene 3 protein [Manis javanica]
MECLTQPLRLLFWQRVTLCTCQSLGYGPEEKVLVSGELQKLLESLEIHMIQEILRKDHREKTLVVSEKSKEQCALPTGLLNREHVFTSASTLLINSSLKVER